MPRATEKCGCGASIEVTTDTTYGIRLTLEQWREGHQHDPIAEGPEGGPHEG